MELKIEYLPVDLLKPYERNARIHNPEDVDAICESIKEFGFDDPIGIWSDRNVIVEGHGRLMAAKKLGMTEVPCIRLDHLTDEQRRAYALAHNRTAELSEWDNAMKQLEVMNITDIDMTKVGFVDDLEDEEDDGTDQSPEKSIESMELKAFEHYDYIVFVFNNTFDWLNAVNEFGLKRVDAGYGKTKKIGIGRVIDGARPLEKIRDKTADPEQGQIGNDSRKDV